jgi:hypothetical protein
LAFVLPVSTEMVHQKQRINADHKSTMNLPPPTNINTNMDVGNPSIQINPLLPDVLA